MTYIILGLAIVGSGLVLTSQKSHANTAPSGYLDAPANNSVFQAGSTNTYRLGFTTHANDADGNRVRTQVMYRKVGEAKWRNYGTLAAKAPDGSGSSPNGITNKYVNPYGWNCTMGWGTDGPPNCDTIWSNGARTGLPAFAGYRTYTPSVALAPGQYEWAMRSSDDVAYGSWTRSWYFTIKAYVPPTVTPTPTPTTTSRPTTTPVPDNPPIDSGGNDSGSYSDNGSFMDYSSGDSGSSTDVAEPLEDKTPPSVPANLAATFNGEENAIKLTWEPSIDSNEVMGYEVERLEKGKTDWQKVNDMTENYFSDFNFEPQKAYVYRVRSYDQAGNISAYSATAEVMAGEFKANIVASSGGSVKDKDGVAEVLFGPGAANSDLFVSIEKVEGENIPLQGNSKLIGNVYEIRAKNARGEEVKTFNTQLKITFNYKKVSTMGISTQSIRMATKDKKDQIEFLKTSLNTRSKTAETLTDHLSLYFLSAEKSSPWVTFLNILLWIFILAGIGAGGYYGYQLYLRQKYQDNHREDYIYKH